MLDSDSDTHSDGDDNRSVFSPELGFADTSTRAVRRRALNYAEDNGDISIAADVDEFEQGIGVCAC